ncbi:MAG: penicillin-binding protein 2 [Gammaproteobacteria bacterium]|nr:penicillin-binding protein 2 [Gammaproteobacteria bacterium]
MFKRIALRDMVVEKRVFQQRMIASLIIFFCLAAGLALRYVNLQVFQHDRFVTESDRNRIHTLPLAPRRGLIYDRKGVLLAENQPSYSLAITEERVENLDEVLVDLQQLFDIDSRSVEKFRQRSQRRTPYQAVPLKFKLNDDEISRFAVNRYRLDGVEIKAQLVRHYPLGEEFSHVIGYVGRINQREQEKLFANKQQRINYAATDHIGKIGLEHHYEKVLHGSVGSQYVETNAHGRVLRVLQQVDPLPGTDLKLSVDATLQQQVHKLMQGRRGSVVVLEVETGNVLAMVSTPSFDPNLFVTGISTQDYAKLRDSIDLPLFNRSLQGQYPPGSTIKPIIGLAGLQYGVVTPATAIDDPGWYQLPNDQRYHRDWKRGGHGASVNLHQAIEQSCDTYFYDLAYKLGIDRIHAFAQHFGLGAKTGIDSSNERSGLLPSRAWKRASRRKPWFPGETLNIGIGQGYMLATPLQLATSTAALANRGKLPKPQFVLSRSDVAPQAPRNSQAIQANADYWDIIHDSMRAVVHGRKGTAQSIAAGSRYLIAGKTGTAQVIGIAQGEEYDADAIAERQRDHALFVGFAPYDKPQVALAVIVENGGSGSSAAAPIARQVFDWVINSAASEDDGKPKPRANTLPVYARAAPQRAAGSTQMLAMALAANY